MADITDNEPLLFKDILMELIRHLPEISKQPKLSCKQKMAYCEILGYLACSLPAITVRNTGSRALLRQFAAASRELHLRFAPERHTQD